jgi:transposase
MSKRYRPWKIDEPMLLPATVHEFVDKDHLARFVLHLVVEEIDLEAIERVHRVDRGQPPFDPAMMTALLLYGYCNGVYSSRRIARACRERVDFMSIVGLDPPDFRTISDFRKRHLPALSALFSQVLRLCERAGLVKLGHVALDGTKIKANASKHKAMSYERMAKRAAELEAEVAGWMDAAAATDAGEDAEFGRDKSGEEMPDWVADKKRRAEKIRAAKAELEAEAKAAAEAERQARAEAEKKREAEGRKKPGRPAAPPSEHPDPKAQKNFTDPESRIMKTKDGFIQGYNAQAAVDAQAQVIVVHGLDANASDQHQLTPMVDAVEANMGRKPEQVSADAGYCSDANLEAMESRNIDAYIAAGRAKHPTDGEGGGKRVADMREKIRAGGHDTPYRLRKQLPEPVFGQIKQARGFRQFLMRGLDKAAHEWGLVCLAHNILKLAHAEGRSLSAAELTTA